MDIIEHYSDEKENMDQDYKEYHAISMHSNGTTPYETLLVIFPSHLYTFLTVLLISLLVKNTRRYQFLIEFTVLVLPLILNMTVLANYLGDIVISLFIIIVAVSTTIIFNIKPLKVKPTHDQLRTNFITNGRGLISLMSVIAILGVDFQIFPRRFAKTETFGYSLMDTGVGLYVFSNGIVAPETKGQKDSIMKSIKSMARFIFVKQTDYNVPVSEYGVHWNFFITLAFTKLFASFIINFINVKYIYINAILIIISHEILLQAGLQKFVLIDTKRDGFFAANKEGLISCPGYISIYLFAVYFGYILDIKNKKHNRLNIIVKFVVATLFTLSATVILQKYFNISRRLANSTYCFWIAFISNLMLGLYYFSQILQEILFNNSFPVSFSPIILESVNYNGLIFFLTANVVTGLINMFINTLKVNDTISLVIIVSYMFVNCTIATLLYHKGIKIKLK
ncbi:hypothetical protein NQ317_010043 [Molorchus minor]|uniref:Phosphatidylinositol-glycan biosynthesis class W protein n=1 Tax=Molorchus minor TaxID=1323400 RepID=A0ABQ9J654_9CUCU|nr:hypothetical protein NQ317_010043 [Molorchus minor]